MRRAPIAILALLVAGCATAPVDPGADAETSSRDCFNVGMISGFSPVDDETLRVHVSASRTYELTVSRAACFNLEWADTIAVASRPSSFLCVGDGASVSADILTDQGDRCRVRSVRRVVDETDEDMSNDSMSESDAS